MVETNNTEEKGKTGSNNTMLIIISILLISFLNSFITVSLIKKEVQKIEKKDNKTEVEVLKSEKKEVIFYKLGEFIVNLANKEASRYIKTEITIEYIGEKESEKEIKNKESVLRDIIINILSSYTTEDLFTKDGKQKVKNEIIKNIQAAIDIIKVKNIYFNSFIMQ